MVKRYGLVVVSHEIICTVLSWDWGYLSIPISYPHPNPQSQLLDNKECSQPGH